MNNPIVKILRLLLFFPICFISMALVNWGFGHLVLWFLGLSTFWLIAVIFFFGGMIWSIFKMFASLLVMLASSLSPISWLGPATISIMAVINGGHIGYKLWTLKESYSGWEIFVATVATLFVLELTFALIHGSVAAVEEHY